RSTGGSSMTHDDDINPNPDAYESSGYGQSAASSTGTMAGMSTGTFVGILVGSFVAVVLVFITVLIVRKKRRRAQEENDAIEAAIHAVPVRSTHPSRDEDNRSFDEDDRLAESSASYRSL